MIPLWIKVIYTAFVAVTVVIYARRWGWGNFLWFSDIALILTVPALWLENRLLASMMTLAILLPEALWNVSYFYKLLTGKRFNGLTDYMFDTAKPRALRALSLFHVFLPPLLVWMVARLGYDTQALLAQTALALAVLPLSYCCTDPLENVNCVRGLGSGEQETLPPLVYLGALMLGFPLLVYLPTHFLLQALFL